MREEIRRHLAHKEVAWDLREQREDRISALCSHADQIGFALSQPKSGGGLPQTCQQLLLNILGKSGRGRMPVLR